MIIATSLLRLNTLFHRNIHCSESKESRVGWERGKRESTHAQVLVFKTLKQQKS